MEADPGALRERIVNAAYEVFLEKGYAGATTELVAAHAKTSKRSLYEVFSHKADMFAAVVSAKQYLILDPPAVDSGPTEFIDRLAQFFRLRLTGHEDMERQALLDFVTREVTMTPQLTEQLYEHGVIRTRETLIDWLHAERDAGRVEFHDAQIAASLFMSIVFGTLQPRRRAHLFVTADEKSDHILACLKVVIAGLAVSGTPSR